MLLVSCQRNLETSPFFDIYQPGGVEIEFDECVGVKAPIEGWLTRREPRSESWTARCGVRFHAANSAQPLERTKLVASLSGQTFRMPRGLFVSMTPLGSNG